MADQKPNLRLVKPDEGPRVPDSISPEEQNKVSTELQNRLGMNRELVDTESPDITSNFGKRTEEGEEESEIATEEDRRKMLIRQNLNKAAAPLNSLKSLGNRSKVRDLQKSIKKINERIQSNNKQIKKLKPPTLIKKTFMYIGRGLLDLITVGASETIIMPVQIVQSLKTQEGKIIIQKLRNENQNLMKQVRSLEGQIYNLQNIFQNEAANDPMSSAQTPEQKAA